MRLYGRRFINKNIQRNIEAKTETRDAILWDVLQSQRLCRVKIQGSNTLIVAYYPENWEQTPFWLKPGNAVKILHTGGARGRTELVGHGGLIHSPVTGDTFPVLPTPEDGVLLGCNVISVPNDAQMAVMVKVGTYRIDGTTYILDEIQMDEGDNWSMAMGGTIETVAGFKVIESAPAADNFRYDLIVVGTDGVIDVVKGNDFTTTEDVPDVPADHVELGRVLLDSGTTEILASDINKIWVAPTPSIITIIITDNVLSWAELTTAVTVAIFDQFGNSITTGGYGWYITLEITSGNGEVSSPEEGSSATIIGGHTLTNSYEFTYTRNQTSGDVSPLLEAVLHVDNIILSQAAILLLDAAGDEMH